MSTVLVGHGEQSSLWVGGTTDRLVSALTKPVFAHVVSHMPDDAVPPVAYHAPMADSERPTFQELREAGVAEDDLDDVERLLESARSRAARTWRWQARAGEVEFLLGAGAGATSIVFRLSDLTAAGKTAGDLVSELDEVAG